MLEILKMPVTEAVRVDQRDYYIDISLYESSYRKGHPWLFLHSVWVLCYL